jgi:HD-like signal output (HDOD) protein
MTPVAPHAQPDDHAVEDALIRSIRIPPRPSLLVDLQHELAQPDPSPRRIARIIGNDVGMSGALLKLANSPFFGAARKAKSVEQAINFLGINQCAALLTGLLARQAIEGKESDLDAFWEISARRAQAVVFTSRKLRIARPTLPTPSACSATSACRC